MSSRTLINFSLAASHIGALLAFPYLIYFGITLSELFWHMLAYLFGGFGLTALYHRSWTHGAVRFHRVVEYLLAAASTLSMQGPARPWIINHIEHHKNTDQEKDPHSIKKGFWWAHFKWIFFAKGPTAQLPLRLQNNSVIRWQERWFVPLFLALNFGAGIMVGVLAGKPWWGGVIVTLFRLAIMLNVVFAINSIGHTFGSRSYASDVSATDVWWFPFALGDQYHNYHHAFPRDYRHGISKWAFDPTKWLINLLALCGLATDLVAMQDARIKDAMNSRSRN